eukprot:2432625-Amphidinium_carterae.1
MAEQDDTPAVDEHKIFDVYRNAAEAIAEADVLFLCTGAGFSADSGLAVYKDIAEIAPYKERGSTMCQDATSRTKIQPTVLISAIQRYAIRTNSPLLDFY